MNTVMATSPAAGLADIFKSFLAVLDPRLAALEAQAVRSEARGVRSEAWVARIAKTMRQQVYSEQAADLSEETAVGVLFIDAPTPIYSAPGIVDASGRYAEGEHFYFERKVVSYVMGGVVAAYFSLGLDC